MTRTYNKHEIAMLQIIREEIDTYVGGLENMLLDFPEDSQEYKDAYDELYGHPAKQMLDWFYEMVMSACKAGSRAEHARFAGSDFVKVKLGVYLIKNGLSSDFHIA
jgi:hypothetical protein